MADLDSTRDLAQKKALHDLATLYGLLGMRWYVLKQEVLADAQNRPEVEEMDASLEEVRSAIRSLLDQRRAAE